jgi:hypothetical protein
MHGTLTTPVASIDFQHSREGESTRRSARHPRRRAGAPCRDAIAGEKPMPTRKRTSARTTAGAQRSRAGVPVVGMQLCARQADRASSTGEPRRGTRLRASEGLPCGRWLGGCRRRPVGRAGVSSTVRLYLVIDAEVADQRDCVPVRVRERRELHAFVHRLDLAGLETAAGEFVSGSGKVIDS